MLLDADIMSRGLLALNPSDRWQAVREWPNALEGSTGLQWLLYLVGAVIAVALAALLIKVRAASVARRKQAFAELAGQNGLSTSEQDLLACIARNAGLKDLSGIFTMEQAFDQGAAILMAGGRVAAMPPQKQEQVLNMISSLSHKLGLDRFPASGSASVLSSRNIPVGGEIVAIDSADMLLFNATVRAVENDALVLQVEPPGEENLARCSCLRYANLGTVWEFDSRLIGPSGAEARFTHSDRIRIVNHRRFPRVLVSLPALAARLSLAVRGSRLAPPAFAEVRLVEIAGPGLLLQMTASVRKDEKLVAVIAFPDGRIVQGIAQVLRVVADSAQGSLVAAELVDLRSDEITELARQTSLAARHAPARWRAMNAPQLAAV